MKKKKPRVPQTTRFPRIAALNRYLEENLAMRILKWVLMASLLAGGTALMVATAGEPPALLTPRALPLPPPPAPAQPSLFSKLLGNAASTPDTTQHPGWAYVYDENNSLISEIGTGGPNSSDTIRHIYLPTPNGPMPIVTVVNGKRYAVSSDHLNTPRRLTDDQGRVVWQRAYSAFDDEPPTTIDNRFANLAVTPNPGKTNITAPKYNIRGSNHYADEESGLVYNGARSLVPGLNRYLQPDPSGLDGGLNRFVHVDNDALGLYDPDGYEPTKPVSTPPTPPITAPITAGGAGRMLVPGGMPKLAAPVPVCPPLATKSLDITEPYKRPSGATTRSQRDFVQGQPCVDCGNVTPRQVADHKTPLVKEYYGTGTIDKQLMRSLDAVQPQCPTCSARQGADLSRYSREQRQEIKR